jgi:hypothetical protein
MTPFTLKVVFIGLMAVSSGGPEQDVVLLAKSEHVPHVPLVYQLKGKCSGDCHWRDEDLLLTDQRLAWQLSAADVMLSVESSLLHQRTLDPRWQAELPSVRRMSSSPAPLSRFCEDELSDCRQAFARVWVPTEELEVCHYLHQPSRDECMKPGRRITYFLANYRAAVADAVMMEVERVDRFVLRADRLLGTTPLAEAELKPEPAGNEVILVVSNLPIVENGGEPCPEPPARLEHFQAFYSLVDDVAGRRARGSTAVPMVPMIEPADPPEMKCEAIFVRFVKNAVYAPLGGPARNLINFPHGASECDMATIP